MAAASPKRSRGRRRSAATRCRSSRRTRASGSRRGTTRTIPRAFGPSRGAGRRPGLPSATRSTSSTWRPPTMGRSTASRVAALTDTVQIAAAIGADVMLPRRLAPRPGPRCRDAADPPRARAGVRELGDDSLAAARDGGRRRRHDRRDVARTGRRDRLPLGPPAARASASTPATSTCPASTCVEPAAGGRPVWAEIDGSDRARPAARAARQRRRRPARLEPRPACRPWAPASSAGSSACSSRTRLLQGLPAILETGPPEGGGPDLAASCASCGSSTAPACGHASARLPREALDAAVNRNGSPSTGSANSGFTQPTGGSRSA